MDGSKAALSRLLEWPDRRAKEVDASRSDPAGAEWVGFGPYRVFRAERTLKRSGQLLQIGDKTLDLLLALIAKPGEILTKSDLAEQVWQRPFIEDGSLRVAIGALRKLLGPSEEGAEFVINVVGRGYMFSPAVKLERSPEQGNKGPLSPRSARVPAVRLPPLLHPIFGRRHDIRRLTELLDLSRFITIVGPGGIGKTTAAISCASLRSGSDGGVCFVDLAPIRAPSLVPSRIAAALGSEHFSEPLDFLAERLMAQRLLIILDNAEQVADATTRVVEEILSVASQVKVMVTSREPLGSSAETVYRLQPLKLPPMTFDLCAAEAMQYSAVELFVDRVQAGAPDFILTDGLAPVAAEICRRLDGVALAIRFAAAHVQAFGVHGVAAFLENRLALPAQIRRGIPSRHQTLEAAFDWSYNLLSSVEQAMLAAIAIFPQSFSLDAILQVAVAQDDQALEHLAVIGSLVAKSLVIFINDENGARYRLLETVRVYAVARLEASGAQPKIVRRHVAYVMSRCELYQNELMKGRGRHAVSIAGAIVDDARAALQWAVEVEDWPRASELIHTAGPLLTQLGFAAELGSWIRRLLEIENDPRKRASLMISLGGALWLSAPEDAATIRVYTDAYVLARSLGDQSLKLRAAWSLTLSTCSARRPPEAIEAANMLSGEGCDSAEDHRGATITVDRALAGVSRHLLGDYTTCERSMRWLMVHYPAEERALDAGAYLYDPRHIGRPFLAWIEYFSGRLSDAASTSACLITDAGDNLPSIVSNIVRSAFPIAVDSGRWEDARMYVDVLERHCSGRTTWRTWIAAMRDVLAVRIDRSPEALWRLEDFVTGGETFNKFRRQAWYYMTLIKGYMTQGYYGRAESLLREILTFVETSEGNWWRPEMLTLDGHLLAPLDRRAAYARYREAFTLAQTEGSSLLELRAALGALRVADDPIRRAEARRQSRDAYRRLTAGSPTAGTPKNLHLLRHALCVCRKVQRSSRSIIPPNAFAAD